MQRNKITSVDNFPTDSPKFNIMSFNIRSFDKNGQLFSFILHALHRLPEIIVMTETWLEVEDRDFSGIEGYNVLHTIREQRRSGGVSVYSRVNISIRQIAEFTQCNETIESCVVEIKAGLENFVLFAIYRPHSDHIEHFCGLVDEMLHSPRLIGKSVIVIGDLNIDLLKQNNQSVKTFMDTMQAMNFIPLITKATRFPSAEGMGAPSLLDHIWTNSFVQFSTGIITVDITDHCPVFLNLPNILYKKC